MFLLADHEMGLFRNFPEVKFRKSTAPFVAAPLVLTVSKFTYERNKCCGPTNDDERFFSTVYFGKVSKDPPFRNEF